MEGGEGSRVEEEDYIENKILAKLTQNKCGAGGLKHQLIVIGQAEDL